MLGGGHWLHRAILEPFREQCMPEVGATEGEAAASQFRVVHEPCCGTLGPISKLFRCSNTPENLARLLMPKYLQILIFDNTLFSAGLKSSTH